MQPDPLDALAESLLWTARARVVNPLIATLEAGWKSRFTAQRNWWLRHASPFLSIYEAEKKPPQSATDAAGLLDGFREAIAAKAFEKAVPAAFTEGGRQAVIEAGSNLVFNDRNPIVAEWMRTHTAEKLGEDVDAVTKRRLQKLLIQGQEEKWTRRQMVKAVKGLWDGFSNPVGIGGIRSRAELIAITEVGNAYSHGSLIVAQDLQTHGFVLEKYWALAAGPCPICESNEAVGWIPVDENFPSGADAPLQHPGCRCSLMTRPKVA